MTSVKSEYSYIQLIPLLFAYHSEHYILQDIM